MRSSTSAISGPLEMGGESTKKVEPPPLRSHNSKSAILPISPLQPTPTLILTDIKQTLASHCLPIQSQLCSRAFEALCEPSHGNLPSSPYQPSGLKSKATSYPDLHPLVGTIHSFEHSRLLLVY